MKNSLKKAAKVATASVLMSTPSQNANQYSVPSHVIAHRPDLVQDTLRMIPAGARLPKAKLSYSGQYPLVAINAGGVIMLTSEVAGYDRS